MTPDTKKKRPAKRRHVETRRAWVERMLAEGHRTTWVIEHGRTRWGCSESALVRDVRDVRARWAEESAAGREVARAELGAQIDRSVALAFRRREVRALAGLLRLKGQFHGLIAEKETSGQVTAEQVAALVAELSTRPRTADRTQDHTSPRAPAAESSVSHRAGEEKTEA